MILDEIVKAARKRVSREKEQQGLDEMKKRALSIKSRTGFPFESMLHEGKMQFICEVKKASPSKGVIAEDFPYVDIAREYEQAGAGAVSVLTEPEFFQGSPRYLEEIQKQVRIPLLRKDFIIDPYQIYQAKVLGADALLLIVSILDQAAIREYLDICHSLGLSALVEAHDEREMEQALDAGARVIGVNNRNLKDFTVDIENSIRLRNKAPENIAFVAESGIACRQDVRRLEEARVNGALIGETLMRSPDKKAMLDRLRGLIP